jgi:hypothetical protein
MMKEQLLLTYSSQSRVFPNIATLHLRDMIIFLSLSYHLLSMTLSYTRWLANLTSKPTP